MAGSNETNESLDRVRANRRRRGGDRGSMELRVVGGRVGAATEIAEAASAPAAAPFEIPRRGLLAHLFMRSIDVTVATIGLVLTAPLMLAIAVWIKLDSAGPVLFRHVRIGEDRRRSPAPRGDHRRRRDLFGKPFTLYKFRTMYADSRERFPELYRYEYEPGELHSMPIKVLVSTKTPATGPGVQPAAGLLDDPRLTRVGRWLRRTSLDELPNLWNVLRGDMHLVGPRPDIFENIQYYEPQHLIKLRVRPGVTGLAQVQGRGNLSFHETNEWDVEYLRNRSVWLDLKILAKTLWVSIRGEGAF
jgi:lipopolysaccharide/colanic/teichoic acid biosynthesis glycosyltransferase